MGSILNEPPSIHATINYYLDPSLGGDSYLIAGTAQNQLVKRDSHRMEIRDMRGREDDFGLDTHGFQLVRHELDAAVAVFDGDQEGKEEAYRVAGELVRKAYVCRSMR